MSALALALSGVLLLLSLLHLAWAIGFWWPIRDEAALARAVTGRRGVLRMPGAVPCALVAVALFFAATVPPMDPGTARMAALAALAAIFALRGAAPFTSAWRRMLPEPAFLRLDRSLYGPLCLALAGGFLILALGDLP